MVGCYLLGFISYKARYTDLLAERSRLLLGTGVLSSFTTYSTFALETTLAAPLVGVAYVVASYGFGFAAVLLGRATATRVAAEPTAGPAPGE